MLIARAAQGLIFAVVAVLMLGLAAPAKAAMGVNLSDHASVSRPNVTNVYWVWRHHHRYWVRPRHR
jgi:hypothetical protein